MSITRVYSWNTYPARLSVRCQIDSACILRMGVRVALLTITTTCDFKRGTGGATKHTHTDTDTKALLFKVQGYIGEALQGARA